MEYEQKCMEVHRSIKIITVDNHFAGATGIRKHFSTKQPANIEVVKKMQESSNLVSMSTFFDYKVILVI